LHFLIFLVVRVRGDGGRRSWATLLNSHSPWVLQLHLSPCNFTVNQSINQS